MTTIEQLVEIAESNGALARIKHHTNVDGDSIVFTPEDLLAFSAALQRRTLRWAADDFNSDEDFSGAAALHDMADEIEG